MSAATQGATTGRQQESAAPAYLAPYQAAAKKHGASFETTLWASREYQRIRFNVFTQLFTFVNATIIDAGAGKGDFAVFLQEQGVRWKRYVGLEAVAPMAQAGRDLRLPDATFHEIDFVRDQYAFTSFNPDVIVFSGSLNTMPAKLVRAILGRAWDATATALLFNFLSDRGPNGKKAAAPARRMNTTSMLDWALKRTPNVIFRHDYLAGHDATIAMWKQAV